jgi:hypothetical protein
LKTQFKKMGDQGFKQTIAISKSGVLKFELDSLTSPGVISLQEYHLGKDSYLVYLNDETGAIYLNDISSKKNVKKIEVGGDHAGFKKMFRGVYFHNKDSIFLFLHRPKIMLINDRGKILREYNLFNKNDRKNNIYFRGMNVATNAPAFLFRNHLIFNSFVLGNISPNEERPIQITLNLETGIDSLGKISFPNEYQGKNYGGLFSELYSVCYNYDKKLAIYSFPICKKVYIYQFEKNSMYRLSAESNYIDDFVLYDESVYKEAKSDPEGEYFMTTPTYGSVYYDKYRDVYYRMALLPVDKKNVNYEEKKPPLKQISIMVFDQNFNYLGEKLLERNKYWPQEAFVSKEGFNIMNRTDSDLTLDFTTFKFSKL